MLIVLGALTQTLVVPLGERLERRLEIETVRQLERVRRALIGHLVTHGVLPCPLPPAPSVPSASAPAADATHAPGSPFVTVLDGIGRSGCAHAEGGVPAAVLGVAGAVDARGALLDAWGRALRYAVSTGRERSAAHGESRGGAPGIWTAPGAAREAGLRGLRATLSLCRVAATEGCPREERRAGALAFVVLSYGADASARDAQRENLDGDAVYALAPRSSVDGYRFDDALVWASRNELAYWLLRAEWLP